MPAITSQSKILVTGASGFIGIHVVKALLDRGFAVRGTVRSAAKGDYLKKYFATERFEYAVVGDMQAPNAFDEAVKGMDAVEHVASPLFVSSEDPQEIIRQAVGGTVGVLESIKRNSPSLKRVVVTSSMAAVGSTYKPNDWNQKVVDLANELGAAASGGVRYSASKVLAERAAWDFVEKHKSELGFDLVTICPPLVFGPMLHEGTDEASINGSNKFILGALAERKEGTSATERHASFSDVRDIATIHADSLLEEKAGGQRFIACAGPFSWQDVYDIVDKKADKNESDEARARRKNFAIADNSSILEAFGKPAGEIFRPFSETIKDTLEGAKQRGWKSVD